MRVLVTGGTGFIGSHLANRLHRINHEVIVPIREGSNSKYLPQGIEIRLADMTEPCDVNDLLKGVDVVFHLASIRGRGWSFTDEEIQKINIGMTENLLKASVGWVRHFIYVSSVSVYGHFKGGPADEKHPCLPSTRYGISKYKAEKLVEAFHKKEGLPTTIIRPVITYGPRDTWGMVTKLIRLINSGEYLTVGSGKNRVHLVYIDDLVDGLLSVMMNPKAIGKIYILAGEEPITINRLVGLISLLLNKGVLPVHVPIWLARLIGHFMEKLYSAIAKEEEPFITRDKVDIMTRDRFFSIHRATTELGYIPKVNYEEGLKKTVHWLRDQSLI